jgi:hypothetical protein
MSTDNSSNRIALASPTTDYGVMQGDYWAARTTQLEARIEVPSIGYFWKSDALETSHADFAVIGEEMNGRYYSP